MADISNKHRKSKFFVRTVADWNKLEDMVVTENSVLHSHLQWAVGYKGLPPTHRQLEQKMCFSQIFKHSKSKVTNCTDHSF